MAAGNPSWAEKKAFEAKYRRLLVALHDTIRRPMGVVPDSALEFYDQDMGQEAEERRVARANVPMPPEHVQTKLKREGF